MARITRADVFRALCYAMYSPDAEQRDKALINAYRGLQAALPTAPEIREDVLRELHHRRREAPSS